MDFKLKVGAFYALNLTILGILFLELVKFSQEARSSSISFFSLGILAFFLGLRHAVDADHLAAIDNSVRKLTQEGKNSLLVGTFFSLGHSSVVFLLSFGLVLSTRLVEGSIPSLEKLGSFLGTAISGGVLYLLGFLNFFVALEIYQLYRGVMRGEVDEERVDNVLQKRGLMGRYFRRLFSLIKNQYYLYPIGFLFGLGFDTASETALLAITATSSGLFSGVSTWYALLFPALFAGGMTLIDSTDGFFMNGAYRWAFSGDPLRKIWYNLTMTVISVMVAFVIGSLELLGLLQSELGLQGGIWSWIAWVNGGTEWGYVGVFIVSVFVVVWSLSATIYRVRVSRFSRSMSR
ncbi:MULTISPECIES: HoxN/HupN/NixA family nickel/cobalt transporter [Metallosphaera]|uniref:HoxN/HupN/NixA family nickel/cobalt transporter n=1 Tax=Metallosphaera TaxID=41980 RepID=UPI001F069E3B|nr:HoxN/HupN/NixA family nickel/cobalt transporter [Metallosphaera sedula]MCH1770317.1 HoxN/HupN/NixA family nickel/cobalt transporter [Metallosphaera sedula]MCP6727849.1 HoxN/HupN/NixA family nickel/cobalt transporter [Metallosphaera sedula]